MDVVQNFMDMDSVLAWLRPSALLSDTSNLFFFREINEFLKGEIDEFGINLLGRTMSWVGSIALTLMTLWIMIQGYRIATRQSREPMMALVTNSLRSVFIIGLATGMAIGGSTIFKFLTDDVSREITRVVTGKDQNAYDSIDKSLGYMQLAMSSIDQLHVGGSEIVDSVKTRNLWFTGIGIAGPAIVAGSMLLLNKVAMALFVGLGPLFILSLMFEPTKQLFNKWLFYGIGTMFSLAVLSVMVAIALDMVLAVAGSFWVGRILGSSTEGINSMALQQGGLGLVLTTLIIMAPPMAAAFFQGMLGQFTAYSGFGGIGRGTGADSAGRTPGTPGYSPGAPTFTGQTPSTGKQSGFHSPSSANPLYTVGLSQDAVKMNPQISRGG
jgi:type IV secretion system protein VirB6